MSFTNDTKFFRILKVSANCKVLQKEPMNSCMRKKKKCKKADTIRLILENPNFSVQSDGF